MPFANIPYQGTQSVTPTTQAPNDYLQVRANPLSFGAQIGAAQEKAGQTSEELADKSAQLSVSFQNLNNQTTALNLSNAHAAWVGQQEYDFKTQYHGQEASAQFPLFQKRIQDRLDEIAKGIPSPVARLAFLQDARTFNIRTLSNIGDYTASEVNKAAISGWKGRAETAKNQAVSSISLNPNNVSFVDDTITRIVDSTRNAAHLEGISDKDAVNAQISDELGDLFMRMTTAIYTNGTTLDEQKNALQNAINFIQKYRGQEFPNEPSLPLLDAKHLDEIDSKLNSKSISLYYKGITTDDKEAIAIREPAQRHISQAFDLVSAGFPANFQTLPDDDQITKGWERDPDKAQDIREQVDLIKKASDFLEPLNGEESLEVLNGMLAKAQALINPEEPGSFRKAELIERGLETRISRIEHRRELAGKTAESGDVLTHIRNLSNVTDAEREDYLSKLQGMTTDDLISEGQRNARFKNLQAYQTALDSFQKARTEDFAGYVIKRDPQANIRFQAALNDPSKFGDYATYIGQKQELAGIAPEDRNLLPKEMVRTYLQKLENDPVHAADTLIGMKQKTGPYFEDVFKDLVKNGLSPQYQVVMRLANTNPDASQLLARTLADKRGEQDLDRLLPKPTQGESMTKTLRDNINNDPWLKQWKTGLMESHFKSSEIENYQNSLETLSVGFMLQDKSLSPQQAVQKALQTFKNNWQLLGNAAVPTESFTTVSHNAGVILNNLSLDNVTVPDTITKNLQNDPHAVRPEEWLKHTRENPNWVASPDGKSVTLMDPYGKFVRDKKGQPIQIPFNSQMMSGQTSPFQTPSTFTPVL